MTLHELVRQAASLHWDRTAVCFDACDSQPPECHTYGALVTTASRLSRFLLLHCDLEEIRQIGLYCQPGINLPSWILGILQAPAAYVPIDPDSPPSLSAYFIGKCGLKYILVEKKQVSKFRACHEALLNQDTLAVEHDDLVLFSLRGEDVAADLMPTDAEEKRGRGSSKEDRAAEHLDARQKHCLAYVLHTSGTTGTPRLVRVPHACVLPNIQHFRLLFDVNKEDTLFLASPLTFDPSVVEMFVALSSGASLLIVPASVKMVPSKLAAALFSRHRVTVLQATPTLLRRFGRQLLTSEVLSASTSLRVLALGGEPCPSLAALRSWRGEGNRTHIYNIYGITEVSSWATFHRVPEEALSSAARQELPVPLGSPLLGTVVEVRDPSGSAVHEGTGQVFLGGRHRVCFLDDETTVPLGTMRATGDFVTVKDGEIFFLGRKDGQIKRHGKRLNIELVQQAAEGLEQVESCAVMCNQEKLVLFVVSQGASVKEHVLEELQQRLPSHAVPDQLVPVDSLPLTSHGKVDVSELNKIYLSYISLKPENKLSGEEELWGKLQYLWKSVLGVSGDLAPVPEESHFLSSGGDSLKSIRLLGELELLVGAPVPGLLELILGSSLLDIYHHILHAAFPAGRVAACSRSSAPKRKRGDSGQEEASSESSREDGASPSASKPRGVVCVALSRGSQVLGLNTAESWAALGPCPSAWHGVVSQMDAQQSRTLEPPAPADESRDAPCVTEVSRTKGKPVPVAVKAELPVRWRSDTGKCVDASPLVVATAAGLSPATVYIGSHSCRMQAIDLHSGKVRWEQVLGDRIESSACVSKCGNFVIVGCYDGLVYVLKSNSGEQYWVFTTGDAVKSSAALDPCTGLIYVGSHDWHAYALDIDKKKCVWKLQCGGAVFSSPCLSLMPHHVYFATLGGHLLAVNPAAGDVVWRRCCGKPLFSSPRCCLGYVCIGCVDGRLLGFTHTGEQHQSRTCFSAPMTASSTAAACRAASDGNSKPPRPCTPRHLLSVSAGRRCWRQHPPMASCGSWSPRVGSCNMCTNFPEKSSPRLWSGTRRSLLGAETISCTVWISQGRAKDDGHGPAACSGCV
ncbi:beta-alanine-activating enzyme isoform X2 [Ochotona princeps]|uniref:beta-alanine-activating enzyme isoform X2 n=1 Tax=Ochotona princeps TaxID=9978 RepID=UPI0027152937|nr:beta-alanine-activating enzyme isoform X2 [Ochotona princeps]